MTLLCTSKDVPRALYEISTKYNTAFIYDCLEFCEIRQALNDVAEREQKNKEDQEKVKQERMNKR